MKLLLLAVIVAAGAGAYFTRPSEAALQEGANAVLRDPQNITEGLQGLGATLAGDRAFEDYYVATKYSALLDGAPVVECWGAFTKVSCTRKKTDKPAG